MDKDLQNIPKLVEKYLSYWVETDIEGLMSMYADDVKYHDMPSWEILENDELHQFILDTGLSIVHYEKNEKPQSK